VLATDDDKNLGEKQKEKENALDDKKPQQKGPEPATKPIPTDAAGKSPTSKKDKKKEKQKVAKEQARALQAAISDAKKAVDEEINRLDKCKYRTSKDFWPIFGSSSN
jgi:hypothetical protein